VATVLVMDIPAAPTATQITSYPVKWLLKLFLPSFVNCFFSVPFTGHLQMLIRPHYNSLISRHESVAAEIPGRGSINTLQTGALVHSAVIHTTQNEAEMPSIFRT
jgi:hypothetical protein